MSKETSKKIKIECICEDCGATVEENATICPNCNASFEEEQDDRTYTEKDKKELLEKMDRLGNTWFDFLSTSIIYVFLTTVLFLTFFFFFKGIQANLVFGLTFAFLGSTILPMYLFVYTKIGYFLITLLLLHKYCYHIEYTKIMNMKEYIYLEKKELKEIEEIKKLRKQKRKIFIAIALIYIVFFFVYLWAMHTIQFSMNV